MLTSHSVRHRDMVGVNTVIGYPVCDS